jgi:hypothetical protein
LAPSADQASASGVLVPIFSSDELRLIETVMGFIGTDLEGNHNAIYKIIKDGIDIRDLPRKSLLLSYMQMKEFFEFSVFQHEWVESSHSMSVLVNYRHQIILELQRRLNEGLRF